MTLIDSLVITLGIDPKDVEKGMNQASSTIDKGIKNIVGNLLAPLAGAFAGGKLVNDYMTTADAVGKMSEALGINIEEMQAWGNSAKRIGGSSEGFYTSVENLNQKIKETAATGKGEGAQIFKLMGLSAKNANGEIVQTTDLLLDLAGKAEKMNREKFIGFAKKLGIDAGTIKLLQSGKKGIEELLKHQKELGVYTKEDADVAAKANNAFTDLTQVFKAIAAVALRVLIPPITFFTEKITALFTYLRKHQSVVIVAFTAIAAVIAAKLVPALFSLGAAGAKALLPFLPWIIAIGALALIIDDLVTYMNGGESALSEFWSALGTPEELMAMWEGLKESFGEIIEILKKLWDVAAPVLKFLAKATFDGLVLSLKAIVGVVKILTGLWDTLKTAFKGVYDFMSDKLQKILGWLNKIKDGVMGVIDGAKNVFGGGAGNEQSAGMTVTAQDAIAAGGTGTSNTSVKNETDVRIDTIKVEVKEGTASNVANGLGSAVKQNMARQMTNAANTGAS